MRAYGGTRVNWSKSQTAIVKMLNRRGIYQTRFTNLEDKFAVEFAATLPGFTKPVSVRILVPIRYKGDNEEKRQRELNVLHRVLFYHLKSKFIAIDAGLTEFMEEFMPHLILMDGKGNSSTLGQAMLPQYRERIESGDQKPFLMLPEAEESVS